MKRLHSNERSFIPLRFHAKQTKQNKTKKAKSGKKFSTLLLQGYVALL